MTWQAHGIHAASTWHPRGIHAASGAAAGRGGGAGGRGRPPPTVEQAGREHRGDAGLLRAAWSPHPPRPHRAGRRRGPTINPPPGKQAPQTPYCSWSDHAAYPCPPRGGVRGRRLPTPSREVLTPAGAHEGRPPAPSPTALPNLASSTPSPHGLKNKTDRLQCLLRTT